MISGVGIGLRSCHFRYLLTQQPPVPWLEVQTDNFLGIGGAALAKLAQLAEIYPVVLHGVGLSIASSGKLNPDYLHELKQLIQLVKPVWISDHICWNRYQHYYFPELLPIPYTQFYLERISENVDQVQHELGCPLLLENVSSYLNWHQQDYQEWDFINALAKRSGCKLLLDINNVYVSANNHDFDPETYLTAIEPAHVAQFHLAGYSEQCGYLLDTHSGPVKQPVWQLFQRALQYFGSKPTSIEWDNNIPDCQTLLSEANKANNYYQQTATGSHLEKSVFQAPMYEKLIFQDVTPSLARALLGEEQETCAKHIKPQAPLSNDERIDIYRHSIVGGLVKVLSETYAVCQQLVGQDFFNAMALQYATLNPNQHFSLNFYGKEFARFIDTFTPANGLPYLSDVARFEWAWHVAYICTDDRPSDFTQMQQLDSKQQEKIQLLLNSSVQLLQLEHPAHLIWQAHQPTTHVNFTDIDLDCGKTDLVIWRSGLEVSYEVLQNVGRLCLAALKQAQPLATLSQTFDDTLLSKMIQKGWVNRYQV